MKKICGTISEQDGHCICGVIGDGKVRYDVAIEIRCSGEIGVVPTANGLPGAGEKPPAP